MSHREAFTQAKDKDNPASNEDRLVVIPDRLYAVIDGATDKSGRTYDGLTGGQIVGRILEDVLRSVAGDQDGSETALFLTILDRVNRRLDQEYRAFGIAADVDREPWRRFSAQVAIAIRCQSRYRFIVVGDTGLRIDGREVFLGSNPGDVVCAQLRAAVHRNLTKTGAGGEASDKWSRAYVVEGLSDVLDGAPGGIGAGDLKDICREAREESQRRLPGIAAEDIDGVLMSGLKGLHRFRNRPGPFGFPCIDGTSVPADMIIEFERPAESIECLEFFSDGYTAVPKGTTVADWEAGFWQVERDDPERVASHPGTKGSTADRFADDRTVLVVHPQAGAVT